MSTHARSRLARVLAALLPALLLACGGGDREPAGDDVPVEAAIVPDASVLARFDARGWNEAPIAEALRNRGAPASAGAEAAPTPPFGDHPDFDGARFAEIVGLTEKDVVEVLLSADVRDVDPRGGVGAEVVAKIPAAVAVRLAHPLPLDTLERALRETIRRDPPPTLTRREVGGTSALEIRWGDADEEVLLVTACGADHTYLAAADATQLASALDRASSGRLASPAPGVARLRTTLSPGTQHELAVVLPEHVRATLRDGAAKAGARLEGLESVRDLLGVALGMKADAELAVVMALDFAKESAAQEVGRLLDGWAPLAHSMMAGATGRTPREMADRLRVSTDGAVVRVHVRVTAADAAAYGGVAAKRAAGAMQQS